jgi:hypothetical protein
VESDNELKTKPPLFRRRPLPRTRRRKHKPIVIPRPLTDPPQDVKTALAWLLPLSWRKR